MRGVVLVVVVDTDYQVLQRPIYEERRMQQRISLYRNSIN